MGKTKRTTAAKKPMVKSKAKAAIASGDLKPDLIRRRIRGRIALIRRV